MRENTKKPPIEGAVTKTTTQTMKKPVGIQADGTA